MCSRTRRVRSDRKPQHQATASLLRALSLMRHAPLPQHLWQVVHASGYLRARLTCGQCRARLVVQGTQHVTTTTRSRSWPHKPPGTSGCSCPRPWHFAQLLAASHCCMCITFTPEHHTFAIICQLAWKRSVMPMMVTAVAWSMPGSMCTGPCARLADHQDKHVALCVTALAAHAELHGMAAGNC